MGKRVAAIVRGPSAHFASNGVLYPVGALIPEDPGVPEEDVSEEPLREKEVEYEARNGDLRKRKIKVRVPFMPVPEGSTAAAPKEQNSGGKGTFNVGPFLAGNVDGIGAKIATGEIDDFLSVIENAENAKGTPRAGVKKAIEARKAAIAAA